MPVSITITAESAVEAGAQMRLLCGATPAATENEEHRAIVAEVKRLQHRERELQDEVKRLADAMRSDGLVRLVSEAQAERDTYKQRIKELEAQVTMAQREASGAKAVA